MLMELKKIHALSLAKVDALIMAIIGLIIGIIGWLFSLAFRNIANPEFYSNKLQFASLGLTSIIIFPIAYGIIGFISGGLSALLYNLAAKLFGGVKIDIKP